MADHQAVDSLQLRIVGDDDFPILYEHQLDIDANRMAAVVPRDWQAFQSQWNKIISDPTVVARAIVVDDQVVGQIGCFQSDGQDCVGYWIGKGFWSRGFASRALKLLLEEVKARPLHARVATHNIGSIRVLEKNGFKIVGYEHSSATERYLECEGAILVLE
jgi:RimJ/RimL family protein N-acetyltransferase